MRFCHPFPLRASSGSHSRASASHQRIGAISGVQCDRPLFSNVSSLRTISPGPTARAIRGLRILTEFPFEHNFFRRGLERL